MTSGENKRKHLDFIQAVITRMNSNSFVIKGWAVALISALFAFAGKDEKPRLIFIALIILPVFWGLDAFYLSLERRYRKFYKDVVAKDENVIDFNMSLPGNKGSINWDSWWVSCLFSRTILPVYLCVAVMAIVAYYLLFHALPCIYF